MPNSISIIGGGFNGICTAYLLAEKGYRVNLIDTGKMLGGVMSSIEKDGYMYDLGCHLFDNLYEDQANLVKLLLNNNYTPINIKYASIVNGIKTDGIDIPNLTSLSEDISADILFEIIDIILAPREIPINSLAERVKARFGDTAAKALNEVFYKKNGNTFESLSSTEFENILPSRLYFLEKKIASFLKKHPDLDKLIAADFRGDPLKFSKSRIKQAHENYRHFYPSQRSMKGFCEQAEKKLIEAGVQIYKSTFCQEIIHTDNGCKLTLKNKSTNEMNEMTTDIVYWAGDVSYLSKILGAPIDLSDYNQPVPMVLYYFNVPEDHIGNYSYIHNFDRNDLIFRLSAPSKYGAVAPEGMGYVCAEIPTKINSDIWQNSEEMAAKIWKEIVDMEVVTSSAKMIEPFILKTPVGYTLKKKGYKSAFNKFKEFAEELPNIYFSKKGFFSKAGIFKDVNNIIEKLP